VGGFSLVVLYDAVSYPFLKKDSPEGGSPQLLLAIYMKRSDSALLPFLVASLALAPIRLL